MWTVQRTSNHCAKSPHYQALLAYAIHPKSTNSIQRIPYEHASLIRMNIFTSPAQKNYSEQFIRDQTRIQFQFAVRVRRKKKIARSCHFDKKAQGEAIFSSLLLAMPNQHAKSSCHQNQPLRVDVHSSPRTARQNRLSSVALSSQSQIGSPRAD